VEYANNEITHRNYIPLILIGIAYFLSLMTNFGFNLLFTTAGSRVFLFHIVSLVLLIVTLCGKKIALPPNSISIYFMFITVVSIFAGMFFGFTGHFFNNIFNFVLIAIIYTSGKNYSAASWERLFSVIGMLYIALLNINIIMNFRYIINDLLYIQNRLPSLFTFSAGGINLDATWVAIFSVFFIKKKFGILYWINATLISTLFSSRLGLILCAIAFLFIMQAILKSKREKIIAFSSVAFITTILVLILVYTGLSDFVFTRFLAIGNEPGSIGRLRLLNYFSSVFSANIFGYGAGNAVSAIADYSALVFREQAIHNIYLQAFLDFGLVGGVFHLALVIGFVYREFRNKFSNTFGKALILFFVAGLFQFSGVEPQLAILLGIYLCTARQEMLSLKNETELIMAHERRVHLQSRST